MTIPTKIQEVRDQLHEHKGDYTKIAKDTDINYWWLMRFARGNSKSPNINNIHALSS